MATSFHTLSIKRIIKETFDTVSLVFSVPPKLQENFQYKPGQYLTLKFTIDGKSVRRSYSMSSSPIDSEIKITIKRVAGGLVSNYVNDQLKEGDAVELMPPQGRFCIEPASENHKTYYLFGGGSGITPLMSIMKSVLKQEPESNVCLLYGNRNEESIIFQDELSKLTQEYSDRLEVEHILSEPNIYDKKGFLGLRKWREVEWNGPIGRPDERFTLRFLNRHRPKYREAEYFICGPGPMMDTVERVLLKKGIDKKNIHSERFASPNISTTPVQDVVVDSKTIRLKTHLNGEVVEHDVPANGKILHSLMDKGVEPPYSCTTGSCSTCLAKCLSGKVKMDQNFTLEDEEVEAGLILTCQSRPLTEEVEITYDI